MLVGDTGIEPVTSSVSGKRATAAPIARGPPEWAAFCALVVPLVKDLEVETGFEPVYAALQAAASPLGHSTVKAFNLRADDRARTGDLNLGKVALYQLSYVRGKHQRCNFPARCLVDSSGFRARFQNPCAPVATGVSRSLERCCGAGGRRQDAACGAETSDARAGAVSSSRGSWKVLHTMDSLLTHLLRPRPFPI